MSCKSIARRGGLSIGAFLVIGALAGAQSQPSRVPTIVAQAVSGRVEFFDGLTPPGWPATLVPPGATILGGAFSADVRAGWTQTAVFEFPPPVDPREAIKTVLAHAGYASPPPPSEPVSGFVSTEPPRQPFSPYCNESGYATFGLVDSARAPSVIAVHLIGGRTGRQACAPQPPRPAPFGRMPEVRVPTLMPPSGVRSAGGGGGWSGDAGYTSATLWTTLPTDSIVFHYTAELVAGGWRALGQPAVADSAAVQRFSFRQANEDWVATLTVAASGDRRDIRLQYMKKE